MRRAFLGVGLAAALAIAAGACSTTTSPPSSSGSAPTVVGSTSPPPWRADVQTITDSVATHLKAVSYDSQADDPNALTVDCRHLQYDADNLNTTANEAPRAVTVPLQSLAAALSSVATDCAAGDYATMKGDLSEVTAAANLAKTAIEEYN